jgi:hypothetical protein
MITTEEKYTVEDLRFHRLFFPRMIPEYLIEQVKGRSFTTEEFYKELEEINEYEYQAGLLQDNPSNFLISLVDPNNAIVGYIWAFKNTLDSSLFVNTLSVDKRYWGKGEIIPKAIDVISLIVKKYHCKKTFWMSTNPKYYEKFGFKRSKNVTMEYSGVGISDEIKKNFEGKENG